MRWLLLHTDRRPRLWLQKLVRKVRSVAVLRTLAKKVLFTREGQVRAAFTRVYALLKAADAAALSRAAEPAASRKYLPSVSRRCRPRLTVVAMARNESARAHDIMRHFCALFDRIILIDHLSEDATARIALSYDGHADTEVIVLRGLDQGYYQSEYMSACANALIREAATDWIFFLDFDEFLPFRDACSFRQALVDLAHQPVIHMHWQNIALCDLDPQSLQGAEGILGPHVSEYKKIALNLRALDRGREVTVAQGNHSVSFAGDDQMHVGAHAFGLFHVPILGYEALKMKISQGMRAIQETVGKDAKLGYHWRELAGEIEKLNKNPDVMREIALRYSLPLKDVLTDVLAGRFTQGTRRIRLTFAQCEPARVAHGPQSASPEFTLETITQALACRFPAASPESAQGGLPAPLYSSLPARPAPGVDMEQALLAATMDMKESAASVTDGHVPFLFTLLEIFRPRRYVELGAHTGVSFFAACQHMRENGNYGEAVAVGQWSDEPCGAEHGASFAAFKHVLDANFHGTGKFIRGRMNAASAFEERSVDILYVKEPYAFDEMQAAYALWRPKLTDNSVLILHHASEHRSNLGVWQFFDSIRDDARASFQFYHGQGIGILAFGSPENNPAMALLKHFAGRPERSECYFSHLRKKLYAAS